MEYRSGMQSEYAPVEFTVSGILYDRDEYTIEASYVVFGSQDFYNERVAEGDRQYNIYFTVLKTECTGEKLSYFAFCSFCAILKEKLCRQNGCPRTGRGSNL